MNPAEALEVLRRAIAEQPAPTPPLSWSALWDLYSADPPVAPGTFRTYGYLWDSWVGQHWGGRLVATTTADDVAAYRLKRKNEFTKRGGRATRPATRNREVMLLRTLATFAHKRGKIATNPLAALDDEEEEDNVRETVVTEEMLELARPWLPAIVYVYVVVVMDSGCRRSEACGLRWDQVDLNDGVLALSRKQTKGRRSRYTMLTPRSILLLNNMSRIGPHVFQNPASTRHYQPDYFLKKWRAACRRAGIVGPDGSVTLHDMRRTFATETRRAGIQESEIMAMGGWKTTTVFNRYNVVSLSDVLSAKEKMVAHLRRKTRMSAQGSIRNNVDSEPEKDINGGARTER